MNPMPKYVLGVTGYSGSMSHDAAASLIEDRSLKCAIEEERCIRIKRAPSASPINAVVQCLSLNNLSLADVCAIGTSWNTDRVDQISVFRSGLRGEWSNTVFPEHKFPVDRFPRTYFVKHHIAHIVAGFCLSGYDDATCICIDGQGENESITIASASMSGIDILRQYDIIYSLGIFYEAAAYYAGLGKNAPGKLMGLSAYGRPTLDMPLSFDSKTGDFKLNISGIREKSCSAFDLWEAHIRNFIYSFYPYTVGRNRTVLSYINFAASAQSTLNRLVVALCKYASDITNNSDCLVLCGGVALNCTSNKAVLDSNIFRNVYIPPGANDSSTAIGAAMEAARFESKDKLYSRNKSHLNADVGISFSSEEALCAFDYFGFKATYMTWPQILLQTSNDLAKGKIIAWHQGRSEFGPRALGSRSLIADPRSRNILVKLNQVKRREMWRPLAPAILEEFYHIVFKDHVVSLDYFMLKTVFVRKKYIPKIPAVVHIDGSTRPQVVRNEYNQLFWDLIDHFRSITGIPMLVNTSLNVAGEPICHTPSDTLSLFSKRKYVDVVVIGQYYYCK